MDLHHKQIHKQRVTGAEQIHPRFGMLEVIRGILVFLKLCGPTLLRSPDHSMESTTLCSHSKATSKGLYQVTHAAICTGTYMQN